MKERMTENEFKIMCVKSNRSELSAGMKEAFNALSDNALVPQWIAEEDCLLVEQKEKNCIYVFDHFDGAAFEKLKPLGYRIFGPQCILTCLQLKVTIPRTKVPIHNLAMKDVVVSCTSIDKQIREDIHLKVLTMGGEISRDFTEKVTHLVAGEVGSKKYLVAAGLKKQIMLPEWVSQVWMKAQNRQLHSNDEQFQVFRCPIFKGLVITVSGLNPGERREVNKLVDSEGGVYTGEMKIKECTHLIINEPKGKKYEFAKKWKIHVVNSQWLYDSVEKGYCQDESVYTLTGLSFANKSQTKTSTPDKSNPADLSIMSNISSITQLNDTASVANSFVSCMINETNIPRHLDLTAACEVPFLDGCKIYLSGFKTANLQNLRKIINLGGGTRFNNINENVTHVVMGEKIDDDIEILKKCSFRPHVVSSSWLTESLKQAKVLDEKSFYCFDFPQTPGSPQPKSSLRELPSVQSKRVESSRTSGFGETSDAEMAELMSQYMEPDFQTGVGHSENAMKSKKNITLKPAHDVTANQGTLVDVEMTQESEGATQLQEGGILCGKKFTCYGFDDMTQQELTEAVAEAGGKVLPPDTRQIPDFAVVPVFGCPVNVTVKEVVTDAWLQICLERDALLPVDSNELFSPVEIQDAKPLTGCVLSISGVTGRERVCLMEIAEILGARCQEYFVRKTDRGLQASTHLIVNKAEGEKYQAARKWGVPILSKSWIYACARSGKMEPGEAYNINSRTGLLVDGKISGSLVDRKATKVKTAGFRNQDNNNIPCAEEFQPLVSSQSSESGPYRLSSSGGFKESQKENYVMQNKDSKAGCAAHLRIMELQSEDGGKVSPRRLNSTQSKIGIDTPSKFLDPSKEFRPSYDFQDLMSALESPLSNAGSKRNTQRRSSLAWDDMFGKHLEDALKMSAVTRPEVCQEITKADGSYSQEEASGPLKDVIIAVSKKLSAHQAEYNTTAAALGADYRWTYDDSCTHFIFQGKPNDLNKEFRYAKEQGKKIVSPYWLIMCKEQNILVDESLFPHNFNPNMSLEAFVSKRKETSRHSRRPSKLETKAPPGDRPRKRSARSEGIKPSVNITSSEGMEVQGANAAAASDSGICQVAKPCEREVNCRAKQESVGNVSGTLEIQEALSKELENLVASSETKKFAKRRNKKLNASFGSDSTFSDSSRSRQSLQQQKALTGSGKGKNFHSGTEASQSLQVTWDDPTERMEKKKLAAQLQRACSPTQEHENCHGMHLMSNAQFSEIEDEKYEDAFSSMDKTGISTKQAGRTPTPDHPCLAMPISKRAELSVIPQQPMELSDDGGDDASDCQSTRNAPVFILSGMSQDERDDYGALVEQLGGKMLEGQHYDPVSTHLVVGNPARNEKFLASVASGKWILHKSYFEACRQTGHFVQEEEHEWGSEATKSLLGSLNPQVSKLVLSAHRWRLKIHELRKLRPECHGAFEDWVVVLCTDRNKEANFRRLLEAGGAEVIPDRPPFLKNVRATHVFLELNKVRLTQNDLENMLMANVHCLRPDYIAAFLTDEPAPAPDLFCPPEVIALRASLNLPKTPAKRRKSSTLTENSKRNKKC